MQAKSENEMPNSGLNLVLVGNAGAGKSATGNTILGQKAFELRRRPNSVAHDFNVKSGAFCGYPVTVYDTPGYLDTELTDCEIELKYQDIFQKCEPGPCVFLLVIKADTFTQQDRENVEKIENVLGEKRLKKTWILFTRGDELEEENRTIYELINENEPLKELLQKYDERYHVFNNKKTEPCDQVNVLLSKFLNESVELQRGYPDNNQNIPGYDHLKRRIVLLGKSGFGKSATGNTILGQKVFRSEFSTTSVTSVCSDAHITVSDRSVSVVDTPGFFDTKMKHEELAEEIARSFYLSSPGPHAFLIVLRADDRFTVQEQQIAEQIKTLFGKGVLKYSIILFTRGDLLEEKSIEELIEENSRLRYLVDQCGGRYHVFNNKDENNREQVNDLLQKIDTMIEQNGGGHYSNQMFEDAERFRQEEEEVLNKGGNGSETEGKSGFKKFLSKCWYYFHVTAVILGVIGGAVVGAVGGYVVSSPIKGAVVGGVLGAVAGGIVAGVATSGSFDGEADSSSKFSRGGGVMDSVGLFGIAPPGYVGMKAACSPVYKAVGGLGELAVAADGLVGTALIRKLLKVFSS